MTSPVTGSALISAGFTGVTMIMSPTSINGLILPLFTTRSGKVMPKAVLSIDRASSTAAAPKTTMYARSFLEAIVV
jgi:hypothetical protein